MSISKFRSLLYGLAKILGDVSAAKSGDPNKISKRVGRRLVGKELQKFLNKIFR